MCAQNDFVVRGLRDESVKLRADAERETRRADRMQDEMMGLKKVGDQKDALLIARNKKVDEYEQVWQVLEESESVEIYIYMSVDI